jgi:hypothetical protein
MYRFDAIMALYAPKRLFDAEDGPSIMRTTLDIREDVMERVKEYAATRSISNGAAASEILERGLNAEVPTKWENGILIFAPGPGAEIVTMKRALAIKDETENELP